jgi:hypothetical protein
MKTKEIIFKKEKVHKTGNLVIATAVVQCPQCEQNAVLVGRKYIDLYIACAACNTIHEVLLEPRTP